MSPCVLRQQTRFVEAELIHMLSIPGVSESGGPGEVGTKTPWRFIAWMMVRLVMDSVRWEERVN